MNKLTLYLIVLIGLTVFCLPTVGSAQKYPLEMSSTQTEESGFLDQEGKISIQSKHASLTLPLLLFDSFKFIVYLNEDEKLFSYTDFESSFHLEDSTKDYKMENLPEKLITSTRGLIFIFGIADANWLFRRDQILATDSVELKDNDIRYMNQFFYTPISNDSSTWSYGFSYFTGMTSDVFIPLLGYKYKGDSLYINSVLPSYFIAQFRLSDHFYFLIDETFESETFRLTDEDPWNAAAFSFLKLISRAELGFEIAGFQAGISYGMISPTLWKVFDTDQNELGTMDLESTTQWSLQIQWVI